MVKRRFTEQEIQYLLSLDAVKSIKSHTISYNPEFIKEFLHRYHEGEGPKAIFESAGLYTSLIGYKRIERASERWRIAEAKNTLCLEYNKIVSKADIKAKDLNITKLEDKLAKRIARSEAEKERIIAAQAAEIESLKAQVKALKALGTLARRTQRAPQTTSKSERFMLIFQLKAQNKTFDIKAACKTLEVSRSGYYEWVKSSQLRTNRELADLKAYKQVKEAFEYKRAKKGSRQVVDCLFRTQNIVMNRKKVQRIMRKFGLLYKKKKKRPQCLFGIDGMPKVADNVVNRDFRKGSARQILSTDITYLPSVEGFSYLSGTIDCETNETLAYVVSRSLEEQFVIDTQKQLEGKIIPGVTWECSDQGCHYTAYAYRQILAKLGINQSMSRKACCWDNAPIESFWSVLKGQIGSTANMTHEQISALVDEYIDYYNNERGQARLGWLTPKEYAATLAVSGVSTFRGPLQ